MADIPAGQARPGDPHGIPLEAAGRTGLDHSVTLQAIMELREVAGSLKSTVDTLTRQVEQQQRDMRAMAHVKDAVDTLTRQVAQQQRDIRWMARAMWMAAGVLLVLGPIVAWLLNHRFDEFLSALAKGGT